MSRQISGLITAWDENGRFHIVYPRVHANVDSNNTEAQLRAYDEKIKAVGQGWSPLKKKSYVAKASAKCFAYMAGKQVTDFSKLVGQFAIFEVDFLPFAGAPESWWIRVESVRI